MIMQNTCKCNRVEFGFCVFDCYNKKEDGGWLRCDNPGPNGATCHRYEGHLDDHSGFEPGELGLYREWENESI